MIIPHVNVSRVASPGREHCHSPVKGCWLARSHRHSRHSSQQLSATFRFRTRFFSEVRLLGCRKGSVRGFPKGKIVVEMFGCFSRDSGAWYRAVCPARGPMSGIGSTVSLCPFGARGFKSHSRRHTVLARKV